MPTPIPLQFSDGATNVLDEFSCESPKACILVMPAMGVRASFYKDFCQKLALAGYQTYSLDLRGHGKSSVRASRSNDYGYTQLIDEAEKALGEIKERNPQLKRFTLGHSLGGQVAALLSSVRPGLIDGMIKIASTMVYHDGWKGNGSWKIKLAGRCFPILAKIIGHFPGDKLGFGGRDAITLISEWGANALSGKYIFRGDDQYEKQLTKNQTSTLSISLHGDWMAPERACQNLTRKLSPRAKVTHLHLEAKAGEKPYNHFNWVKRSDQIIQNITEWQQARA